MKVEDFNDEFGDSLQFSNLTSSLSPIVGLTTSFRNGISTNLRANTVLSLREVPFGMTLVKKNSLLGSLSYSFTRGLRLSLPFSNRKMYLNNDFNINFNFDLNNSSEKGSKDKINFVEQNYSKTRKGVLRLTYVLTEDITAGMFYEYRTNETRLTGKRVDRDFGLTLNISIR